MDQALEQVAEWVAQELNPGLNPDASAELDRAADVLQEAVRKCTRSLVQDRKLAEVFLRNRRDQTTALGRRWTVLTGSLRERMRQIVVQVRPDITASDAALHADVAYEPRPGRGARPTPAGYARVARRSIRILAQ